MSYRMRSERLGERSLLKKKQKQRGKPKVQIPARVKIKVAMMVILGMPWLCIKTLIIVLTRKRCKALPKHSDITNDHIKNWAAQAVNTHPELVEQAHDIKNGRVLRLHRLWKEYEVATWIRAQNHKGIAVPTAIVKQKYIESWGMGPHMETLAVHLQSLQKCKKNSAKAWARLFRSTWDFSYGAMPTKAPLTEAEISRKVCHRHGILVQK